jgi:hypothetical protein
VKPLAKIGSKQMVNFIQHIIFCFGVPNSIITDNDTQFTRERFLDFCDDNNIWEEWVTVAQPRTNEQVECANGLILLGLKPCILTQEGEDVHAQLSSRARKWAVEVSSVLWSLQIMPNRSTNFTLFFMVYGTKVMLPTELQYGSPRVQAYQPIEAKEARQYAIDLLKESRDIIITRSAITW